MGWCISPNGDPSTRMPFPALPSWRQHAIGPGWEALAHETATSEAIAEAAE